MLIQKKFNNFFLINWKKWNRPGAKARGSDNKNQRCRAKHTTISQCPNQQLLFPSVPFTATCNINIRYCVVSKSREGGEEMYHTLYF